MKKLAVLILGVFLITSTINAQSWGGKRIKGNGNMTTKERKTSEYDEIDVAGFFNVELVSGAEGNITIEAEENLIDYIVTEVNGDRLVIKTKNGYSIRTSMNRSILVIVPFKDISKVSLSGSGDVVTKNRIKADTFRTNLSGSGDVDLEIDANRVTANVSGSGDMKLNGNTSDFNCNVTGSGDIHAYELKAKDVTASVTGSGDVKAYCDGVLKANIVGSGDVTYQGNPTKEISKVVGSGDVNKG